MIRRFPLAAFFILACGVSWVLWAPLWLPVLGFRGLPVLPYQHALGALGPISAAFWVSARESPGRGPRELLAGMAAWRGRVIWILVALLGPFVLLVGAMFLAAMVAGEPVRIGEIGRSREFPQFGVLGFLAFTLLSFGYGEEVGWRGFALPRLQAHRSALSATLLLSVGWALWHLPLFLYRPGFTDMGLSGTLGWLVSLVTGAVLLTWLFNESRGSLLVVALFHASVDVAFTSDVSSDFVVYAAGALITLWGILVVVLAGPRDLSRRGRGETS